MLGGSVFFRAGQEEVAGMTGRANFRLYWEAVVDTLKDRQKILLDADKMPELSSLWLMRLLPFDSLRMPFSTRPPVLPPEAAVRRKGRLIPCVSSSG